MPLVKRSPVLVTFILQQMPLSDFKTIPFIVFVISTSPATDNLDRGFIVPMPTLPTASTTSLLSMSILPFCTMTSPAATIIASNIINIAIARLNLKIDEKKAYKIGFLFLMLFSFLYFQCMPFIFLIFIASEIYKKAGKSFSIPSLSFLEFNVFFFFPFKPLFYSFFLSAKNILK